MATQEIVLPGLKQPGISLIDRLHGLVVTVDHKKLGLMYVSTALGFLLEAGLMALAIRLQLAIANPVVNRAARDPQQGGRMFHKQRSGHVRHAHAQERTPDA